MHPNSVRRRDGTRASTSCDGTEFRQMRTATSKRRASDRHSVATMVGCTHGVQFVIRWAAQTV